MRIWENGSDFHYIDSYNGNFEAPWDDSAPLYNSGRQALFNLLLSLKKDLDKTRIWMPAYYCGEVTEFLPEYEFLYYDCDPTGNFLLTIDEINSNDLILINCYFGVNLPRIFDSSRLKNNGVMIIEDHSQNPFSALAKASTSDYCFASLRKTLPLPDGGVVWSPIHSPLPIIADNQPPVSIKRIAAMLAKKSYLESQWPDKDVFREWFVESEGEFGTHDSVPISSLSLKILETFDTCRWVSQRLKNHQVFYDMIIDRSTMFFDPYVTNPMGIVILDDTAERISKLKNHFIRSNIYPAILWPVDNRIPKELSEVATAFASRCLFLHCDGRYNSSDMEKIAKVFNNFGPK